MAAADVCRQWARIAALCDVHTAVLRRDDGSCGICESERIIEGKTSSTSEYTEIYTNPKTLERSTIHHAAAAAAAFDIDFWAQGLSDIELDSQLPNAGVGVYEALMAELDHRTAPHGRVLAPIAGGSGEDEQTCGFSRVFTIDGAQHYAGCGNAATYSARHKIDGDQLGCCDLCADRAKRRGYTLSPLPA